MERPVREQLPFDQRVREVLNDVIVFVLTSEVKVPILPIIGVEDVSVRPEVKDSQVLTNLRPGCSDLHEAEQVED